jgi:hypothetical protein
MTRRVDLLSVETRQITAFNRGRSALNRAPLFFGRVMVIGVHCFRQPALATMNPNAVCTIDSLSTVA